MQFLVIMAAVAGLASGATVRLPPGPQPLVVIRGQAFDPPVTIVADGADVAGVNIQGSKGIIWKGGTIRSPGGPDARGSNNRGLNITQSQNLNFDGVTFTDARVAVVVEDSDGIIVRNSHFTKLRSDGIDLAGASNVLIEKNKFDDFHPVVAIGKRGEPGYKDGDHPDAVQMWASRAGKAETDVVVRNNIIHGDLQGINTFGPSGDGHKRVVIENNQVQISFPAGISVIHCIDCKVRGNTVQSIPGSRFRANSYFKGSTGSFCGNRLVDVASSPGNLRC